MWRRRSSAAGDGGAESPPPQAVATRNKVVKTGTLDPVKSSTPTSRSVSRRSGEGGDGESALTRPTAWWARARTFLIEVRNEMKRVTWPSRREVYATTVVVILVSIFFGLYLWVVDLGLSTGIHWLLARFGAA
jgi:preprotein translocase subunit SecE